MIQQKGIGEREKYRKKYSKNTKRKGTRKVLEETEEMKKTGRGRKSPIDYNVALSCHLKKSLPTMAKMKEKRCTNGWKCDTTIWKMFSVIWAIIFKGLYEIFNIFYPPIPSGNLGNSKPLSEGSITLVLNGFANFSSDTALLFPWIPGHQFRPGRVLPLKSLH